MPGKKEIIIRHVIPLFGGISPEDSGLLAVRFEQICKLHEGLKYEQLEVPGAFEHAAVFLSLEAMVHSYYFCPHKLVKKGTRIWKKLNFIFFGACLLERKGRTDYVQMLESGKVLSFRYADLLNLMESFPEVRRYFLRLFNSNEGYYHQRNIMLSKPPLERTRQLREENPFFIKVASQETQSIHVNLCLRAFINQLNKLK